MMDIETCSFHLEEALLDVKEAQQPLLTQLRAVKVGYMPHLKHLWKGHTQSLNLCNLAEITVHNCASIKNLFPLSMARNLRNLRSLEVVNCSELKLIFDDDIRSEGRQSTNLEIVKNIVTRPLLKKMVLKEVGCFSSIFPPDHVLNCQSFVMQPTQVTIENCKTDVYYCSSEDCETQVDYCSSGDCGTEVDYCSDNFNQFERYHNFILPNIRTLIQLVNLSQLRHIIVQNSVALSNSKSLFPRTVVQALRSLEILQVVNCNELENLIEPAGDQDFTPPHENNSATCFPCLLCLTLDQCDKLKTVFPLSVAQSLPRLRVIFLSGARELEEIFTDDLNEEYVSGRNKVIELPELTTLRLRQLPRMSRMCPAGYELWCQKHPESIIKIYECPLMSWKIYN